MPVQFPMIEPIDQLLTTIFAFQGLSSEILHDIAQCCVLKEYSPEETVIAYGENSTTVFFLVSGSVRATMFTHQGREISYQDLGVGEMFGELAAIDLLPRSTSVITRERSRMLQMSGDSFQQLMERYPAIGRAVLQKMTRVVRFLCDRVYNFGALDVRSRVRAELCRLAETQGVDSEEPQNAIEILDMPRHQELANSLATHREAVSRELSALEKAGLIRKGRRKLLVLDLESLRESIDG